MENFTMCGLPETPQVLLLWNFTITVTLKTQFEISMENVCAGAEQKSNCLMGREELVADLFRGHVVMIAIGFTTIATEEAHRQEGCRQGGADPQLMMVGDRGADQEVLGVTETDCSGFLHAVLIVGVFLKVVVVAIFVSCM